MLVIEGADNSGKSTLALAIFEALGGGRLENLVESEGPPKFPGELNDRVRKYNQIARPLFVRHPCVSQKIYEFHRRGGDWVEQQLILDFYNSHPLFIYCDPLDRGLADHKVKDHDKPEHITMLALRHEDIVMSYRAWALRNAHIYYRIGDDVERVIQMVKGVIG